MKANTRSGLRPYARNSALLVAGLAGPALGLFAISGCEGTLGNVGIHGRPCTSFEVTGEHLGGLAAAQAYSDAHGQITDSVCFKGDDGSKQWYVVGQER